MRRIYKGRREGGGDYVCVSGLLSTNSTPVDLNICFLYYFTHSFGGN